VVNNCTKTQEIVEWLRTLADEWFEMCGDIHVPLNEAADTILALLERVRLLEEGLGNIKYEAERENGSWVHLKRCIAVQASATLKGEKDQ
jgi:hypothetical protein